MSATAAATTTVTAPEAARPARRAVSTGVRPPRVAGDLSIEVRTRKGPVRRPVRDLSLTGLFAVGIKAPVGREIPLTLTLPAEPPLCLQGRVVRCADAEAGVAMIFSRIGWDDMLTIARYLAPRI